MKGQGTLTGFGRAAAVATLCIAGLAACGGDTTEVGTVAETAAAPAPAPVPLEAVDGIAGRTEWAGPLSAAAVDMNLAVRDTRGWDILWQLVGSAQPGPLPAETMAIAVFAGPRPTGGYNVSIRDIVSVDGVVEVRFLETEPPADSAVTQAVTAPWALQLLPLRAEPVRFVPLDP